MHQLILLINQCAMCFRLKLHYGLEMGSSKSFVPIDRFLLIVYIYHVYFIDQ
ncbi:hypothetical protein C7424_0457 [Pantoea ananatis]|nr:hypothetical protein C7424_0457 [Pantoea ananatis]